MPTALELSNELESNANWQSQLNDKLQKSDFNSIEYVKYILAQPLQLKKLKEMLTTYKQNMIRTQIRFEELQTEKGTLVYDNDTHQNVKAGILKSETTQNQKNQERKEKFRKFSENFKKIWENHSFTF